METISSSLTPAALLYSFQAPVLIVWIIGCNFAILTNTTFIIVIAKTTRLQSKSNFLVVSLCVAEIFQNFSWEAAAIKRLIIYKNNFTESISQVACIAEVLPINIFPSIVECMAAAISFDRFLALATPIFYSICKKCRYIFAINLVCWMANIIFGLVSFFDYEPTKILSACTFVIAFGDSYNSLYKLFLNLKTALTIALDVGTLSILVRCLYITRQLPPVQRKEARLKLELDTIRTLLAISVIYLLSVGLSSAAYVGIAKLGKDLNARIAPAVTVLPLLNSASHLIVYLTLSKLFRDGFCSVFCKNTVVVPLQNVP